MHTYAGPDDRQIPLKKLRKLPVLKMSNLDVSPALPTCLPPPGRLIIDRLESLLCRCILANKWRGKARIGASLFPPLMSPQMEVVTIQEW